MNPIGRQFMDLTRYEHVSQSDQVLGLPAPPLAKPVPPDAELIRLPDPKTLDPAPLDLRDAIERRRSVRHYAKTPLTLGELSYLLWCTQGVVDVVEPFYTLRTVPSAGGRHALETYILINRIEGIPPGLYRYLPFSHEIIVNDTAPGVADRAMAACMGQAFVRSAAVAFFWSCIIYRMAWRYAERSYRLVHLDAGHAGQNLYLSALQIGCGTCAIGAFDDQLMADLLSIDGKDEFAIYCAAVGKTDAGFRG